MAIAALLAGAAAPPVQAETTGPGFADKVARLLPAVAAISTVASTGHGRTYFYGSGFVIDPSGIIVTNRHVIAGAFEIDAILPGEGRIKATPMFISSVIDLALLKVNVGHSLPALHLGDSSKVQIGDEVLLLGNPLGVGLSVSHGIVSALGRDIGESIYDYFIQTDAPLNHGNSGGPMVDMHGDVIGIDTGLTSSPGNTGSIGIGYAMPIYDAEFVIDQVLRTGRVVSGSSGVKFQTVTDDLAAAFGMAQVRGSVVTAVDPAGPAAGHLEVGDIVLEVNGQDASNGRAIARMIGPAKPGTVLATKFLRRGVEMTTRITVAEVISSDTRKGLAWLGHEPKDGIPAATPAHPGMTLASLTDEVRRQFGINAEARGAVVVGVAENSAAAHQRLAAGDVIQRVGDATVNAPEDVPRALQDAVAQHRPFVPLLLRSEHGERWVALPLEADR
ncbi:MAG: trypsin-like peptidase domain-containing protein [Acetobacteraceae bacterium]|nr:trypsin-like peptidase domain-containing protein [Acetobacteraceae bacterium]